MLGGGKWEAPFVITKVHANNTVAIKYLNGKKKYLFYTEMVKKFNEAKKEKDKAGETEIRTQEQAKRTYNKCIIEGR